MMSTLTHPIVEGLWSRFKGLALALHRQDRLETAHEFVGWLESLTKDEAQIADIALSMTLRALHVATDPVNFRILQHLRKEDSISFATLMSETGLSRIPLHERISVLMQAGLAVQELESDDVRATQLTGGVVALIEQLRAGLQQAIVERLSEVV